MNVKSEKEIGCGKGVGERVGGKREEYDGGKYVGGGGEGIKGSVMGKMGEFGSCKEG